MAGLIRIFKNGILNENPVFIQAIGMCPTLAVTTSAGNGAGMGLTTLAVLAFSNLAISLIRNFIPDKVRIPSYIVVIAGFVTIVQMLLQAYAADLNASLGIYIPLIVVNCIILARAEAFASKNGPAASFLDGAATGLGFTAALTIIGSIREFLGSGAIFGIAILPEEFPKIVLMILPPGAFITLACITAVINYVRSKNKKEA